MIRLADNEDVRQQLLLRVPHYFSFIYQDKSMLLANYYEIIEVGQNKIKYAEN